MRHPYHRYLCSYDRHGRSRLNIARDYCHVNYDIMVLLCYNQFIRYGPYGMIRPAIVWYDNEGWRLVHIVAFNLSAIMILEAEGLDKGADPHGVHQNRQGEQLGHYRYRWLLGFHEDDRVVPKSKRDMEMLKQRRILKRHGQNDEMMTLGRALPPWSLRVWSRIKRV